MSSVLRIRKLEVTIITLLILYSVNNSLIASASSNVLAAIFVRIILFSGIPNSIAFLFSISPSGGELDQGKRPLVKMIFSALLDFKMLKPAKICLGRPIQQNSHRGFYLLSTFHLIQLLRHNFQFHLIAWVGLSFREKAKSNEMLFLKKKRQIRKMPKIINLDFLKNILSNNTKIINIRGETISGSIL